MKIGRLLTLEYKKSGQDLEEYHCKIIDKNEQYLIIDYPIHKKTKKTAFFPVGTFFSASYLGDDKAVYQFRTNIVKRVKLNVPAIAITLPKKEEISRIQRREFVRINATVDIAVHSPDQSFKPFTTVTLDISGGGLSVVMPNRIDLEMGEILDIWLALGFKTGEYDYPKMRAQVVFTNNRNNVNTSSIQFLSINQKDQQMIVRYSFEKQREARKKERT